MLPKYLQVVVNFSRRSDLTKKDVIALQKLVRKVRCMVDRLAQNGAPNRALKTSCKELLDAVESCSDKSHTNGSRREIKIRSRTHSQNRISPRLVSGISEGYYG